MNIAIKNTFLIASLVSLAWGVESCKKKEDEVVAPQISLRTGSSGGMSYITRDTVIAGGGSYLTGITATKGSDNVPLKSLRISVLYDGIKDSTLATINLSGNSVNVYSYDYTVNPRSGPGTERYVYTVTNDNNIANFVTILFTTQ